MPSHRVSQQLLPLMFCLGGWHAPAAVFAQDNAPTTPAAETETNPTQATESQGLAVVEDADDADQKLVQIEAKMGFYPIKSIGASVGYDLHWVAFDISYLRKMDNFGHLSNRRTFDEYAANAKFFFVDELIYVKAGIAHITELVEKVKSGWEIEGSGWSTLLGIGSRWRWDSLYVDVEWAQAAFPIQYDQEWKSHLRFNNKDPNAQDYQDWRNEVSKKAPDSDRQLTLGIGVTF